MKILVTGFKPFLGHQINPSEALSKHVAQSVDGVTSLILPVEFGRAADILSEAIVKHRYDHIVMLGQAAGRSFICFEKVALNWVETENADEVGSAPLAGPIIQNQDLALMTKFPVDKYWQLLKKEHWPVKISFSAGTYVCNDLYFRTLFNFKNMSAVFVHVPLTPDQIKDSAEQSMPYDMQKEVITRFIRLLSGER